MVDGYSVDVREADCMHRLRAANPALFAAVSAHAPDELQLPDFPFERDAQGNLLSAPSVLAEATRGPAKPPPHYEPPAGVSLEPIDDTFSITCHASPDAGWPLLKDFLSGVSFPLIVGMYDFTSAHILQTIQSALARSKDLGLVLDHPAPDRSLDQSDEATHTALTSSLGQRLHFAWALDGKDPFAAVKVFEFAYHIKVAVRDGSAFWLSSGNWNNSNQPESIR